LPNASTTGSQQIPRFQIMGSMIVVTGAISVIVVKPIKVSMVCGSIFVPIINENYSRVIQIKVVVAENVSGR
jgi:hypothetical protein